MPGNVKRGRSSAKSEPARARRASASRSKLACPDCDFVAKHAMGLGRHRSARHGVVSQRQARRDAEGGWITRREAARRAGVHYNTIRHWEQTGRLRTARRGTPKTAMVNASDLASARSRSGAVEHSAARIQALEDRFNELIAGLEDLVSSARKPAGQVRRRKRS